MSCSQAVVVVLKSGCRVVSAACVCVPQGLSSAGSTCFCIRSAHERTSGAPDVGETLYASASARAVNMFRVCAADIAALVAGARFAISRQQCGQQCAAGTGYRPLLHTCVHIGALNRQGESVPTHLRAIASAARHLLSCLDPGQHLQWSKLAASAGPSAFTSVTAAHECA